MPACPEVPHDCPEQTLNGSQLHKEI